MRREDKSPPEHGKRDTNIRRDKDEPQSERKQEQVRGGTPSEPQRTTPQPRKLPLPD